MMPLEGLRVLDVSRYAPGPYCTMLLADLGADVIMVEEPPNVGRRVDREMGVSERALTFMPMRRSKRSVALDLKDERMLEMFFRLAETSDVLVEGFRPGVAKRLGVDYESVKRRNPRIIYCAVTGYGQTGPYAQLGGHDLNYISIAGIQGMVGRPSQGPAIPVNIIGDFAGGGLFAAFSIMTAVFGRQRSGRGQYIDMAMTDGALALAGMMVADSLSSGTSPRPGEYFLTGALPCYHIYETADGKWLSVGCMEPWFWKKLCGLLGCPQYGDDQFNAKKFDDIFAFLHQRFKEKSRDEWVAELMKEDVCVTPVYGLDEALADENTRARGMLVELQHPEYGTVQQVGVAPKFSETPGQVRSLPPRSGQHTEEVLREVGYSPEQIAAIVERS